MSLKSHFELLCTYNLWAHQRLATTLRSVPGDLMSRPIESSFSSLRSTILHICDAETIWLNRLQGSNLTKFPSQEFEGSHDEVLDLLERGSREFLDHITGVREEDFSKICHYRTLAGTGHQNRFSEMIVHCMNHSTYHRGQIVTLMRQTGLQGIPATDMIVYLREQQSPDHH